MYRSLQACRAAAALMVVLFHLAGTFGQTKYFGFAGPGTLFAWGDAGVDFFFVLSGFLITIVHRGDFGRPSQLPRYLSKRVLRIYPTYWIICAGVCALALAAPVVRAALPSDPWVFVKALLLIPQDPDLVGGTGSPILFVAWSLQYEMAFYAVFAAFVLNRALGAALCATLLAVALSCQFGASCSFPASFIASPMVLLFALGVAAAYVARGPWWMPQPLLVASLAALGFVAFGMLESQIGRDALPIDRRLVYGALAAVIIVGLVHAEDAGRRALDAPLLGLLGDSSYALYLLHIPVISVLCKGFARLGVGGPFVLTGVFAFIVVACVAVAVAFHLGIERPLLARLHFGKRRATPAPAPAEAADTVPVIDLIELPAPLHRSRRARGAAARSHGAR